MCYCPAVRCRDSIRCHDTHFGNIPRPGRKRVGRVMTRDSVGDVPNQPKTPQRSVRIPDEVWEAAKRMAAEKGETMTAVILRALKRYAREGR